MTEKTPIRSEVPVITGNDHSDVSPDVRRARARAAVWASEGTGDILPRKIYEIAEVEVPSEATDEVQRAPEKKKHWWSRRPERRYIPF
jgi:hypothetical protein